MISCEILYNISIQLLYNILKVLEGLELMIVQIKLETGIYLYKYIYKFTFASRFLKYRNKSF